MNQKLMIYQDLDDKVRIETDPNGLKEELADEFMNGDSDEALERMDNLEIDIDELDL